MVGDETAEKLVNYSFHVAGQLTFSVLRSVFHAIQNEQRGLPPKLQQNSPVITSKTNEYAGGQKTMEELTAASINENSSIQCTSVTEKELHGFDQYAEQYGLRFSIVREKNDPSHYIFSFMQKDMSKLGHAMEDFLKDGQDHGDLAQKIHEAREEAFTVNRTHAKERGPRTKAPHQKAGPTL